MQQGPGCGALRIAAGYLLNTFRLEKRAITCWVVAFMLSKGVFAGRCWNSTKDAEKMILESEVRLIRTLC